MSHPRIVEYNGVIFQAEYSGGAHVLSRYRASDGAAFPFADGSMISTILSGSSEAACGLAIRQATGVIFADVPTPEGLVTRMSRRGGDPGSWITVGS